MSVFYILGDSWPGHSTKTDHAAGQNLRAQAPLTMTRTQSS